MKTKENEMFALSFGKSSTRNVVILCMVLVVMTFAVYWQTGNQPFLSLDDPSYVSANLHVSSGINAENIRWAFSTDNEAGFFHPVTWLSHMIDAQLYGMNPGGHHLTNVFIHTMSSVLLLLLLFRCTYLLWQSFFVAALFALHPLHVESVAWVAERKDVLSAFFWFLTLLFYSEFVARRNARLYILALSSFILGLMSKPMLVTLPIAMLLMDLWPLGRYRLEEQEQGWLQLLGRLLTLVKEKIPFFACSLFFGVMAIYTQHNVGATDNLDTSPLLLRIGNALNAYVMYIIKTLWPQGLAVYYPFPLSIPPWQVICSLLVLIVVSFAVIRVGRKYPYLPMGWLWFLITLVPVIGLVKVGNVSMADRFTYIPGIGLFIMAAWGVPEWIKDLQHRKEILAVLASVVIVVSAALTWHQLGYWRDNISLYRHTLQVTSGNSVIHCNLGLAFAEEGLLDAAIQQYQESLRIDPSAVGTHNNLAIAYSKKGLSDAAIQEYQTALRLKPGQPEVHINLGVALANKGDIDAAILEYQEALRLNPNDANAHNNLGFAFANKGNMDAAILEYQEALRLNPNDANVHNNLGFAFASKGTMDAAILEYQEALRINPNDANLQKNLVLAQRHH